MIFDVQHYKDELKEIQNSTSVTHTTIGSLDQHLVINTKTREILIPTDFRFLGVENDHAAKTFYFEIDRYYDNTDLSAHTCIVQYLCSNGTLSSEGFYPVTEFDLDSIPDKIIFGWTINNDVTSFPGEVHFAVRFYSIVNNSFSYNFNTLEAKAPILDGIDTTESSLIVTPSVLAMWEQRMNNLNIAITNDISMFEDRMSAQVTAASNHANNSANSATKSAESANASAQVLEDTKAYVEFQKDAFVGYNRHETDTKYANALIGSAYGTGRVIVEDAWEAPVANVAIAGMSEQVETTGAQLLDLSVVNKSAGGAVVITEDGGYKISGTGLLTASFIASYELDVKKFSIGNLILKSELTMPKLYVRIWDGNTMLAEMQGNSTKQITPEMLNNENLHVECFLYGNTGSTITPGTYWPMLYQFGDGMWEPYTGGKPSPSPEYPQPVKGTGTVSTGAQLFDASKIPSKTAGGVTVTNKGDGSFIVSGSGNLTEEYFCRYKYSKEETLKLVKPGKYGMTFSPIYPLMDFIIQGTGVTKAIRTSTNAAIEITEADLAVEDVYLTIDVYGQPGKTITPGTIRPMVWAKETLPKDSDWEPYTGGKPSPSPEYPQQLDVMVTGINILPIKNINRVYRGITYKTQAYGSVRVSGTATDTGTCTLAEVLLNPGTYTYSGLGGQADNTFLLQLFEIDSPGGNVLGVSLAAIGAATNNKTITIDRTMWVRARIAIYGGVTVNDVCYPMLNAGPTAQPWQPYQSRTATITLTEPLRGIGDHKDEITMTKRIDRCVELVFDGSEAWTTYDTYAGFNVANVLPAVMRRRNGYCNQLIVTDQYNIPDSLWIGYSNRHLYVNYSNFYDDTASDKGLAAWKAHLAAHPLRVVTYLDTPVETDLDTDTQSALNALTTYTGTTQVTIIAGGPEPDISIGYVQDTQSALDNLQNVTVTPEQISEAVESYIEENPGALLPDNMLQRISDLENQVADLLYKAISLTSFTSNVTIAELGSTVNSLILKWTINKIPSTLTLDGEAISTSTSQKSISNAGITSNKTYRLTATDDRGASSSKSVSISFLNGCYYGVSSVIDNVAIDNQLILSLTKVLSDSKARTITVNPGTDEYIYYGIPTRLGTPVFKVGGFEGGLSLIKSFNFTNASGYTEKYDVYRSTNKGLGNITIDIS